MNLIQSVKAVKKAALDGADYSAHGKNELRLQDHHGKAVTIYRQYISRSMLSMLDAMVAWAPEKARTFWNSPLGKQLFTIIMNECFYRAFLEKLALERLMTESRLMELRNQESIDGTSSGNELSAEPKNAVLDSNQAAIQATEDLVKEMNQAIAFYQDTADRLILKGRRTLHPSDVAALSPETAPAIPVAIPVDLPDDSEYLTRMREDWMSDADAIEPGIAVPIPDDAEMDESIIVSTPMPRPVPRKAPKDDEYLTITQQKLSDRLHGISLYQNDLFDEMNKIAAAMEGFKQTYMNIPSYRDRRISGQRDHNVIAAFEKMSGIYGHLAREAEYNWRNRAQLEMQLTFVNGCLNPPFAPSYYRNNMIASMWSPSPSRVNHDNLTDDNKWQLTTHQNGFRFK